MLSMHINHPDSMDFIKVKRDGTSVTGANISLRLSNEFMEAVKNDEDYILRFPCDIEIVNGSTENIEYNKLYKNPTGNSYYKKIKAKEYWDEIIKSARNYAEPGLMYWDNVLDYDPAAVYDQFIPTSSNPCGEQFLNPFDSCRLMALNLFSFVDNPFTDNAKINFDKLFEVSYLHTILGDVLVDLELEYISRIINKINADPEPMSVKRSELDLWIKSYNATKAGRRIGLGLTALGDTLAALGIQYGSKDSLEVIEDLMSVKMEGEFTASIDMSIDYGTFKGWNASKEFDYEVDPNTQYIHVNNGKNKFYQTMLEEFPELVEKMIRYGRRNVSLSTIAPTGSTSLLSQTTSGCEPLFMPFYMRRKKVNPSEEGVDVDFVDEVGDSWQEFAVLHPKFKDWMIGYIGLHGGYSVSDYTKEELQQLFEKSPWYGSTANDIDWIQRNKVQAVLQKYTTNAISSTINLPSTVTEEEVSDIYLSGWDLGLKGQTVYVDGSRSGVLVDKNTNTNRDEFEYVDAVKRPKDLECECHVSTIKGVKYNIFVGLLNNKPYEVFISDYFTGKSKFILSKVRKGRYDLLLNGETYSENITSEMSDEQEAITRLVSTSLRHGTNIKYIVEQLQKTTQGDMFGFTRGLARVLKKYIPDGEISTVTCQDCESKSVIFEEGCFKCMDCGSSACG